MTAEELFERYGAGERNFADVDLSYVDFGGYIDLDRFECSNINLSENYAIIPRKNLSDINLRGANLTRANLECLNLRRTNLSGANLDSTILSGADLTGANLSGANLDCTFMEGTLLVDVNLRNARLGSVTMYGADLTRADFTGADWTGSGSYITFCNTIMPDGTLKTEIFGEG